MTTSAISAPAPSSLRDLRLVIISGMSGAGKSVALHALEDAGYYCVDNLPPTLLLPLLRDLGENPPSTRIAISMDARSSHTLSVIPQQVESLRMHGVEATQLFLDASNEVIMRRFSETRRKHPLTRITSNDQDKDLLVAINRERILLAPLREHAHVIDTSMTRATQLRTQIKELLTISNQTQLTLVLESFAFKRGVPTDADFVFDVRMLPNPHYEPHLRPLTGRDQPVADFLLQQPKVMQMHAHIRDFLQRWLPELANDHRSYVTIAIGCTGGQHRSVFLVEQLYKDFNQQWVCLKRHREMELAQKA